MRILKKYTPFLVLWVIDALLLYFANMVYPTYFVLGNAYFGSLAATLVASLVWTLLVWNAMVLAKWLKIKEKEALKMAVFYLAVNFIALWVMTRFSLMFGFGVAGFKWLGALAFVANLLQWLGWSLSAKK